jgi:hypothetical protein
MATFVKYTPQSGSTASTIKRTSVSNPIYVASTSDHYLGVDTSINLVTITLPLAAVSGAGKVLVIKDESGNCGVNNITIAVAGVDTIDTHPGYVMLAAFESITVVSDGVSGWFII